MDKDEKYSSESVLALVLLVRIDVREKKPVIQRYEFNSLFKALDSFFYHATDLNEVFFNP